MEVEDVELEPLVKESLVAGGRLSGQKPLSCPKPNLWVGCFGDISFHIYYFSPFIHFHHYSFNSFNFPKPKKEEKKQTNNSLFSNH